LDGNSPYAESIEKAIADFHNAPSALLFNSGFDANSGIFSCLPQKGDVILYDEYIHASVHEGMRLSRAAALRKFAHNDVDDFERVLQEIIVGDELIQKGERNVFVAVESVYSMDGDVAPLIKLLDILDRLLPRKNGHMIVDEAHSTGVFGDRGRGLVCALGVENRVLARLHTFGKALSSGGAVVLCPPIMREYLINYARSLIYTTAMGLPTLAMIKTVYRFLREGETEESQRKVWHLIAYLHDQMRHLPENRFVTLPKELPKSPISFLWSPCPRSLATHCQKRGFVVRPIVPPTVPEGGQRVRICLHSGNTTEEVDGLVCAVRDWIREREMLESAKPLIAQTLRDVRGGVDRPRL
jgi:8-amino-7-oxononanoate synthase